MCVCRERKEKEEGGKEEGGKEEKMAGTMRRTTCQRDDIERHVAADWWGCADEWNKHGNGVLVEDLKETEALEIKDFHDDISVDFNSFAVQDDACEQEHNIRNEILSNLVRNNESAECNRINNLYLQKSFQTNDGDFISTLSKHGDEIGQSQNENYPWLEDRRDAEGRREHEADFDPSTLYIPAQAFNGLTPFERQVRIFMKVTST